jgi:hypothetical protein
MAYAISSLLEHPAVAEKNKIVVANKGMDQDAHDTEFDNFW